MENFQSPKEVLEITSFYIFFQIFHFCIVFDSQTYRDQESVVVVELLLSNEMDL